MRTSRSLLIQALAYGRSGNAAWASGRSEGMPVHAWIFGAEIDRERMLDMDRRLSPVRRNALGVLGFALLISAPWIGPWTFLPLLVAAGMFKLAKWQAGKSEHPEYAILGAWIGSEAIIALAVALTGGPRVATIGWLVIPIVTLPSRFSERLVGIGAVIALTLLGAVAFGTDAHAVLHDPPLVIAPAATIIAVSMLLVALMRSDIEHRGECVIDQLTGLLNRKALATRAEELEQQSVITGEPVGVIVGDLDHFKRINDESGHEAGDAALKEIAYRLRKHLRAFDLVYRLGGEEFLVLVPGADLAEAATLAENLRVAVAAKPLTNGSEVTMSLGVSASTRGEPFSYRVVFREADDALYEAKQTGRDRVCVAGGLVAERQLVAVV
jgi:diguanylate cyclase (GGDEF)-like protein